MIKHITGKSYALLSFVVLSILMLTAGTAHAKDMKEIDASVDVALRRFKAEVKGANEYLAAAKGILVIPDVKKIGFVVGAQWGEGSLRIDGKSVDYYKMKVGSAGFQAGYQKANFIFLFLTQEALDDFRTSSGWSAGVEGGITVVDASTPNMSMDTLKAKSSVVAFAFGKKGLMGGWSAKGSKFTKLKW